jgi:hypothetical protein
VASIELKWNNLTPLNDENISGLEDAVPGIYRISYKHPDSKIYVFFVGKSQDIKKSLQSHLSPEEKNPGILSFVKGSECFFKYAPVVDEKERNIAYGLAFKFYQPSCNADRPEPDENFTININ